MVATIFLQRSKTDLTRCGAPISVSPEAWSKIVELLGPRSCSSEGPIFVSNSGSGPTKAVFLRWLRNAHVKIGVEPLVGQAGHSPRRGGAQHLFNTGWSLDTIKVKGRWASDSWRKYINLNARVDAGITLKDPFIGILRRGVTPLSSELLP